MLPGLVACLASIFLFRRFPAITGRTPFVIAAGLFMAAGTFLSTCPPLAQTDAVRIAGLALSGFFAIILIMSWFDEYARLSPRAVIVLAGCALSVAAFMCWGILSCPAPLASILVTLLPLASLVTLPAPQSQATESDEVRTAHASQEGTALEEGRVNPGIVDVMAAAVPARTLVGLAITFFIVRSIGALAPEFNLFSNEVAPVSLLVPLGITVFFIASALFVRRQIDPAILYKILLSAFAACVALLAFSVGISASLVFYASITADVFMWTMLALWAKKTPVKPHLVFAVGWIAECTGNTLGQGLAPLFANQLPVFFAVALMLILIAAEFAFSEGHLTLDIDFEDAPGSPAVLPNTGPAASARNAQALAEQSDPIEAFGNKYDLSPREREVFALWITGRGLKNIENRLFISESTVKTHLRNIYRKCDTHNRTEIIELFERESA